MTRKRFGGVLIAVCMAIVGGSVSAAPASAGSATICSYPTAIGSYGHCPPGPRHTLTSVRTHSSYGSCSGAWTNYPNDFYAGYACQGADSVHTYGAGNLLYGASHSNVSYVNYLGGTEYY